jgi:hypothetical protein
MRILSATLLLASLSSPLWMTSCKQSAGECSCSGSVGLILHAGNPPVTITGIQTSGAACSDAEIRCIPMGFSPEFTAGCSEYQILPHHGGACTVHVDLANGIPFETTADMKDESGPSCCAGIYAIQGADVTVPSIVPDNPPPEVVLTADDVPAFIQFVDASIPAQTLYIRDQLEQNAGNLAIAQAFVDFVTAQWPVGTVPDGLAFVTLEILQSFRSPAFFNILDDFVWRPIPADPNSNQVFEITEMAAVAALECVQTAQAQAEVQRAAMSHPDPTVRSAAADAIRYPNCRFGQPVTP